MHTFALIIEKRRQKLQQYYAVSMDGRLVTEDQKLIDRVLLHSNYNVSVSWQECKHRCNCYNCYADLLRFVSLYSGAFANIVV